MSNQKRFQPALKTLNTYLADVVYGGRTQLTIEPNPGWHVQYGGQGRDAIYKGVPVFRTELNNPHGVLSLPEQKVFPGDVWRFSVMTQVHGMGQANVRVEFYDLDGNWLRPGIEGFWQNIVGDLWSEVVITAEVPRHAVLAHVVLHVRASQEQALWLTRAHEYRNLTLRAGRNV